MRADIQKSLEDFPKNKKNLSKNKQEFEYAESLLKPGEHVFYATPMVLVSCSHGAATCSVLLTDSRILFVLKRTLLAWQEEVLLKDIRAVTIESFFMSGSTIYFHTLTHHYAIQMFWKRDVAQRVFKIFEDAHKRAIAEAAAASASSAGDTASAIARAVAAAVPSAPAEPAVSPADEILKYKNLLDCGAITQEEFEAMKKKLLGL